MSLAVSVH
ncbi:hypothetical protein CGLO_14051 [Colletotrichum gloeosporioides Cg-14]|uniref:Uncharacterized protein n=1 Tax=Colletotrichum gloeosporioides (strain Cg-14) TaxID=1237896 RepID=T0K4L0_COLGC|nr:hypothetical protein CGLO_14051 [Colletotrichum gloeosporioides Cg-14]